MSNTPPDCDSPVDSNSKKYLINVITSEPQVIDNKKNFFIEDRRPSRSPGRRYQSMKDLQNIKRSPSHFNIFTKEQKKLDEYITSKIKTQSNIDLVLNDPLIEKMLSK